MPPKRRNQQGPNEPESPGKFMIALGGFCGFFITVAVGLFNGGEMIKTFIVAMVACLICGFIMKLFACYIEKNIDEMLNKKADEIRARREREEAEESDMTPAPEPPTAGPPAAAKPPSIGELDA